MKIMFKKIFKLFLSNLVKILPSGIPLLIIKGPLKGYKWILGAAAGEAKGLSIVINKVEDKQLRLANFFIPVNGNCFDIGANVGLYSLLFSKRAKSVYSFEPFPRNIYYLKRNLFLNKIINVNVIPYAVSNVDGFSNFEEGENFSTGKLDFKGNLKVKTMRLDTFIKLNNIDPDLIKIDVEGAEYDVLRGAEFLLENYKPIIFLSTHGIKIKEMCFKYLRKLNYKKIHPIDTNSISKATEFLIMH